MQVRRSDVELDSGWVPPRNERVGRDRHILVGDPALASLLTRASEHDPGNEMPEKAVPRGGIEPPTRGFSVPVVEWPRPRDDGRKRKR